MSAPPTGVLFNEARAKPLSTIGLIQPGAYYQFYLTGTTTPANVYADGSLATPLSQTPGTGGTTAASDGRLVPIYMNPAIIYRYQLYSVFGVLLEDVDPYIPLSLPTAAQLGGIIYPQTSVEIAASITPTNLIYPFGDLRRYGATGGPSGSIPSVDDSTAFASAVACGQVIIPRSMAFKIVTGATFSGSIRIEGSGPASQLYNDSTIGTSPLLTLTNGDSSYLHDFYVGTITPPLTIQRYVPHTASTTATTTISVNSIVVASAAGIIIGMQCFGDNTKIWNGAIVTNVAGTTITLSKPSFASASNVPVRFQSITFNIATPYPVTQGTDPYTTRAQSTAAGRASPSVNDLDVWPRLSGAEQTLAQIGAVLSLGGNGIIVERLTGQGLSINFQGASNSEANHCILRGGWSGANIMFFNTNSVGRISNNRAIGNMVSDHAFQGVAFMACDGCTLIGNTAYGLEEAGFKTFVNGVVGSDPCTGIVSIGNQATACFQQGFDFTQQYPTNGSMSVPSSSIGDQARWCPLGGLGYNGSGWNISGVVAELNGGFGMYAPISDSIVTGVFRENGFFNYSVGVLNLVTINGTNNTASVRVFNETTRNTNGYLMAVSSTRPDGVSGETYSTSLVNCDLRDLVTAPGVCLILGGGVTHLSNVRTNGALDTPLYSPTAASLTYGPSITPDLSLGNIFNITATNGTAFTVNAPISIAGAGNTAPGGQKITIRVLNTSGGALGAVTWNAAFKLAAWTSPATGLNRSIEFQHNGQGTWYEINRTTVDVPN